MVLRDPPICAPCAAPYALPMGLRILLVEDDPNDAELVRACLDETSPDGVTIVQAASLAAGLRALQAAAIDIVVLDLDLPDSSGFHTLDALAAATSVPLVVVTGHPHPALASEAFKRGACQVLEKTELNAGSLMRVLRLAIA